MENKIKNMEYWKKKNNIPGIDGAKDSGLTDGRAGSAPFQMATPGESPNKIPWGRALGGAFGSLFGLGDADKKVMGLANQAVNLAQGAGGGGTGGNAVVQPVQQPVQGQQVLNQQPVVDPNTALVMHKSPMEQAVTTEETREDPKVVAGQYLKEQRDENDNIVYVDERGDGTVVTFSDPNGILEIDKKGMIVDKDYTYDINEQGEHVITGVTKGEPGYEPPVRKEDMQVN